MKDYTRRIITLAALTSSLTSVTLPAQAFGPEVYASTVDFAESVPIAGTTYLHTLTITKAGAERTEEICFVQAVLNKPGTSSDVPLAEFYFEPLVQPVIHLNFPGLTAVRGNTIEYVVRGVERNQSCSFDIRFSALVEERYRDFSIGGPGGFIPIPRPFPRPYNP
jgi:hypothetical protein